MKIEKNKVVEISYTLTVDGAIADHTDESRPLDFIFGIGSLLPKFEENLMGKEPGDSFAFVLTAAEGYGEYNKEYVLELPKSIFEVKGKIDEKLLVVGNVLPMMNNNGDIMRGKILEVRDDAVIMDFNHQMAGKELHFEGKVLTVRDAAEKELSEGLHGEFKSSCGGNCSSCGGNCGC